MKTEDSVSKNWEDLVFENRNHEYGAYVIRKSYSDNLLSGAFLSMTLGILVLLIPLLSSFMGRGDSGVVADRTICPPPTDFILPPIIELEHVAATAVVVKSPNITLPPKVVADETDEVVPTNVERAESLQSADGSEGGVPSASSGVGSIETPAIVEPDVFDIVQVMPQYDGGMEAMYKFIQKKIRYPAVPRRIGLGGTVYVSFVVDANGGVTDVKVSRGVHIDLDKEAARVIALLPAWKAGRQHDRNVAVRMTLPIKFQLNN